MSGYAAIHTADKCYTVVVPNAQKPQTYTQQPLLYTVYTVAVHTHTHSAVSEKDSGIRQRPSSQSRYMVINIIVVPVISYRENVCTR